MKINWTNAQKRLEKAGFAPGIIDGDPGKATFSALLGYTAKRQPDALLRAIAKEMSIQLPKHGIMTDSKVLADFISNTCLESGGYTTFEENMCYSAKRLCAIWPNRFKTLKDALPYAWDSSDPDREDVALANFVYGSRMGNEKNGLNDNDGWNHRGGGILQHTGEEEYRLLKERLGYSSDDVRDPVKSVLAACDGWERRNLTVISMRDGPTAVRKKINGGTHGLSDVLTNRVRLLNVLEA